MGDFTFTRSTIRRQVISWVNESNLDFKLEFAQKKLYLVVKWIDGASLFMDDFYDFQNELIETYCALDKDTFEDKVIWFNKLFGIGSEYHRIADDACETESADLNKMEKEREI
tara:strand:+ start:5210 stop:5548 length:339 start_codon:yes stop_codon:yes gene_type:complete